MSSNDDDKLLKPVTSKDNADSPDAESSGSTVSLVSVVDVLRQKALEQYRNTIPGMPSDNLNPQEGLETSDDEEAPATDVPVTANANVDDTKSDGFGDTQGLVDRVENSLSKNKDLTSGEVMGWLGVI